MIKDWEQIADYFNAMRERSSDEAMRAALTGVKEAIDFINQGPLRQALFGWTSVCDLCVQQADIQPYGGPYLRLSPWHGA